MQSSVKQGRRQSTGSLSIFQDRVDLISHALGSDLEVEESDAMLASGELVYCNTGQLSRRSSDFAQPILLSVGPEGYCASDQHASDYDCSFNPGSDNQWELESNLSGTSGVPSQQLGFDIGH